MSEMEKNLAESIIKKILLEEVWEFKCSYQQEKWMDFL